MFVLNQLFGMIKNHNVEIQFGVVLEYSFVGDILLGMLCF